ncbi:MAG TPA: ABC transporter permease [Polyangiales bacterium]|nr:ABC transporter permease [Polyangiales bacterium]
MNRLLAIAWKELVQLRRDRMTFGMMVGIPIMQLMLFGYAINTDVRHMPTLVYDQDHSLESRDLVARLRVTGFYDIAGHVDDYDQISRALRQGEARVAIVIPPDFGRQLRSGRGARAQLVVDGSDPQTVASATNTAVSLGVARSVELTRTKLMASGQLLPSEMLSVEPTTWYNPELKTAIFVVPGLVGVILTLTMIMFTAMAVVRERERGTLEQLIVSPVGRVELVVGKIVPYIAIGYIQMSLILGVGSAVFQVPLRGSLALLYLLASVFIAANLALGLFFSTLAKTQQQAMQMSFFFLLPNILLSGFMFPYEGMPKPAQWLSQALPLTHFLRIVRGITLKGAMFPDVRLEFVWLALILLILVVLSSLRFSKKLG